MNKIHIYRSLIIIAVVVSAFFASDTLKAYDETYPDSSCSSGTGCHHCTQGCGCGTDGCETPFGCSAGSAPICSAECSGGQVLCPGNPDPVCTTPACGNNVNQGHCPSIGQTCVNPDSCNAECITCGGTGTPYDTGVGCTTSTGDPGTVWQADYADSRCGSWSACLAPSSPVVCNNNGTCDAGEDSSNCPSDCGTTITVTPGTCTNTAPGINRMAGCLYNDKNLTNVYNNAPTEALASGNADNFTAINEDWGNGGPGGLSDNFSIRWQGTFTFSGGTYTFTADRMDDGYRVYIDNTIVNASNPTSLDRWFDQCCNTQTDNVTIPTGTHTIKVEYYENTGGAKANLSWAQVAGPPVCPAGTVVLWDDPIKVGQVTTALVPDPGFTGGVFKSADNGIASTSGANGSTITGQSVGVTSISGTGWNYSNGATNCNLNAILIAVQPTFKAHIVLNPSAFTFSGISGGASPAGQTMTIQNTNTGIAALNWTASAVPGKPATWCHVSPASGTVAAGASQSVTISVDSPSNAGSFTDCGIRISDPLADNSPQDVSITYNVKPSNPSPSGQPVTATLQACPSRAVNLAWSDANSGASIKKYNIYRSTANDSATATLIANVDGTSYSDSPPLGNTYYYWIETISGGLVSPNRVATVPASVTVNSCSAGPGPATVTVSTSGLCEAANVSWSAVPGATTYYVYRNINNTLVGANKTNVGNVTAWQDANILVPNNISQNYYYWVSASGLSGESLATQAVSMPIAVVACVSNLTASDKDISSMVDSSGHSTTFPTNDCNGFDLLPPGTVIKSSYTLTFTINLCNNSSSENASNVVVRDEMTNLNKPAGGWQARYQDASGTWQTFPVANISENLSDPNNPILVFAFPPGFSVPKANPSTQIRKLTFQAVVAPVSGNVSMGRFKNKAVINYDSSAGTPATPVTVGTPFTLYFNGAVNVPSRTETQPN